MIIIIINSSSSSSSSSMKSKSCSRRGLVKERKREQATKEMRKQQ